MTEPDPFAPTPVEGPPDMVVGALLFSTTAGVVFDDAEDIGEAFPVQPHGDDPEWRGV